MAQEVIPTRRERFDDAIALALMGLRRWDKMLNDIEKIADDYAPGTDSVKLERPKKRGARNS